MTRIAVFADIHGNLPALEAVLDDLMHASVDEVLVGGDLVGRGPEGSAVVSRVRSLGFRSVRGNHEDLLLALRSGNAEPHWLVEPEWAGARWMAAELSSSDVAYIEALPFDLVAERDPELRLVHGSPRSNREGIGPWTERETLEELVALIKEPLLVSAHTHRPLVREAAGTLVVNVGSVGLPFNGDPRAHYAVLEHARTGWRVEPRRVPYDRDETLAAYRSTGFLAAGGLTARLLEHEVRHARSYLVPFDAWLEKSDRRATEENLMEFLHKYQPDLGVDALLAQQDRSVGTSR